MPTTPSRTKSDPANSAPQLDDLRAEIDALDDILLDLIERRLTLAGKVAARKGHDSLIKLRPRREAGIVARLTARAQLATPTLISQVWRELMAHSLQSQGRTELILCARPGAEGLHERIRARFGWVTPIVRAATPDEAIDRALDGDAFAVIEHDSDKPWWTRLATEPTLSIFDSIEADGDLLALAVGRLGADEQRFRVVDGSTPTGEGELIAASGTLQLRRNPVEGAA